MLAEIHGKSGEEDRLTSHAFGVLEAIEARLLLGPWLGRARRTDGTLFVVPPDLTTVHFSFWPRLEFLNGGTRKAVEPDVLVTLGAPSGSVLVLIEAKFRSGPSGYPAGPDADAEGLTGQLGREWAALHSLVPDEMPGSPANVVRRELIYLTADVACPTGIFDNMAAELVNIDMAPAEFARGAYWLDWRELAPILDTVAPSRVLIVRLRQILERRRLVPFTGCRTPRMTPVGWTYRGRLDAWQAPRVTRVPWTYRGDVV